MDQIIQKYCSRQYGNGLFLIDMPTGFGKTHAVLDYIYSAATSGTQSNQKIIFITTLKKNLPIRELQKRFEKNSKKNDEKNNKKNNEKNDNKNNFEEKFLFIDSNADCVIQNLTEDLIKKIPESIKSKTEYKILESNVAFIQSYEKNRKNDTQKIVARVREELRVNSEPKFRKLVSQLICRQFPTVSKRLSEIHKNKDWQWLGELYPSVFTRERQILFMSVDKFLTYNATIIEPSYIFYRSDLIQDAIIFIDEFDATKETLLKSIIQNGLRDQLDLLELFGDIHAALETKGFPAVLTTSSKRRTEVKPQAKSLQTIIDDFKRIADDIHSSYCLQFSCRTNEQEETHAQNFLFRDHKFRSVVNGKEDFVTIQHDQRTKINHIDFVERKSNPSGSSIYQMLGKIQGFIHYFAYGIGILANNYIELKQERRQSNEDAFTWEAAVRSILAEFRLNPRYIDYLTSAILEAPHKKQAPSSPPYYDQYFYEKGFQYFSFENDRSHDMQSQIMLCAFQNTPEKILFHICEKAKVIGISATASVPTVIGNYDIDYLRSKMNHHPSGTEAKLSFHIVDKEETELFTAQFQTQIEGYQNITIHTKFLSGLVDGEYSPASWKQVFSDKGLADHYFNHFGLQLSDSTPNYIEQRYVKIALAYKEFILHQDIQSFLCLLTKHPRKGDPALDFEILLELFNFIIKENAAFLPNGFTAEESVVQLDGDGYSSKKEEILKRLSEGKKLFVISVYQTMGAGQNIQYPIPQADKNCFIKTGDFSARDEKDFDAIYVDKPTHLLVHLDSNVLPEEFVKYIFQIEFLQQRAEISSAAALRCIKNAFQFYSQSMGYVQPAKNNEKCNRPTKYEGDIYNCKSVALLSARMVLQAIGRICRTNQKKPNIYIYADENLVNALDCSIEDERLLNPEFAALLAKIKEQRAQKNQRAQQFIESSPESAASLLSVKVNTFIHAMLSESWTADSMQKWKELRKRVLSSPTYSAESAETDFIIKNFYVQLPNAGNCLYYCQEHDFSEIQISFSPSPEHPFQVSEGAARLKAFMQIPGVEEHFKNNQYAATFLPNEYLMSPALFHNIYMGALGEEVGCYLLNRLLQIDLEEIENPEQFELFDFYIKGHCTNNSPQIYVDFKHWRESTQYSRDEMHEKIRCKLEKCNAHCALIINILGESNFETCRSEKDGITILEVPCLYRGNPPQLNINAVDEIRRYIHDSSH